MAERQVVTGAFSFTGRFIAEALLERGVEVATLTRRPIANHPLRGRVQARPLQFNDREKLRRDLEGASVLYNTYWVRFRHSSVSFDQAIENTRVLLDAARAAGIRKFVHISVSNPSEDSPLALRQSAWHLKIKEKLHPAVSQPAV